MDSKDRRTKRQKIEDMANQSASPLEAEIAKKKLEEVREDEPLIFAKFIFNIEDEENDLFKNWSSFWATASGLGEY